MPVMTDEDKDRLLHEAELLLRDVLEFGDVGYGMAERIRKHLKQHKESKQ